MRALGPHSRTCSRNTWHPPATNFDRSTTQSIKEPSMPQYTPPLRDMQFVMHEVLNVVDELRALPAHPDIDAETINAVIEEGGKFAASVVMPINLSGDAEG